MEQQEGSQGQQQLIFGYRLQVLYPFWYRKGDIICDGIDSDCTVVTLQRVANFRVKHLNSDIERTRRDVISLVLLFILPVKIFP